MSRTLTVDEMMSYKPCNDYPRERVVELWAGSEALSAQQVADLEIPAHDRIWALCAWLARLDRASLSAFARGRADRARQHADAAYAAARAAAYAAYAASAASAYDAAYAASAAASAAASSSAAAADAYADASAYAASASADADAVAAYAASASAAAYAASSASAADAAARAEAITDLVARIALVP